VRLAHWPGATKNDGAVTKRPPARVQVMGLQTVRVSLRIGALIFKIEQRRENFQTHDAITQILSSLDFGLHTQASEFGR
jgi:hypothetical protein